MIPVPGCEPGLTDNLTNRVYPFSLECMQSDFWEIAGVNSEAHLEVEGSSKCPRVRPTLSKRDDPQLLPHPGPVILLKRFNIRIPGVQVLPQRRCFVFDCAGQAAVWVFGHRVIINYEADKPGACLRFNPVICPSQIHRGDIHPRMGRPFICKTPTFALRGHPSPLQGRMGLMCGRYVMSKATGDLLSHFEAKEVAGSPPPPSWNVAPTQSVPIVAERLDEGTIDRHLLIARWGLVPSWAKDIKIGSKLINARSESILEKPSFRKAAVKRRAIIPAEGYFEWQKTEDGKKIPNYLFSEKEPLLGFAGLYEWWAEPSLPEDDPERWLLSCTVLTTTTQDALGHVISG
jgi:putative SOS response-associated peptidase YedK